MKEVELAAAVAAWLRDQHWEVYQEVTLFGSVCDLVATRGPVVWAIECKTTMGLKVLEQACYWRYRAHLVSAAVPFSKRQARFNDEVFGTFGIGILRAYKGRADISVTPGQYFRVNHKQRTLRSVLCDEHKWWAPAGNAVGARFTPFQQTKQRLLRIVAEQGSVEFKALLGQLQHHYVSDASARGSLLSLIEAGVFDKVVLRREGKKVFVEAADA